MAKPSLVCREHSIQNANQILKGMTFDPPHCQWFSERFRGGSQDVPCIIVSVDMAESSVLKAEEALQLKSRVRDIIGNIARDTCGEPLFWAGDGGAFLFPHDRNGATNCFEFCARVQWLSLTCALSAVEQRNFTGTDVYNRVVQSRQNHELALADPDDDDHDLAVVTFRTVCMEDKLSFTQSDDDTPDKSTIHGAVLNHALKYEREIGLAKASVFSQGIAFPEEIVNTLCDPVTHPRRLKSGGDVLAFRISPRSSREKQKTQYESTSRLSIIDVDLMQEEIGHFLNPKPPKLPPNDIARIYNISPYTLITAFPAFWGQILQKCKSVHLLLPQGYHFRPQRSMNMKLILKGALKKGLQGIQPAKQREILRDLGKMEIKVASETVLQRSLSPLYAFSLYYERCEPKAGALAFLMEPFSEKVQCPIVMGNNRETQVDVWRYRNVIFSTDMFLHGQFKEEEKRFQHIWNNAPQAVKGNDLIS